MNEQATSKRTLDEDCVRQATDEAFLIYLRKGVPGLSHALADLGEEAAERFCDGEEPSEYMVAKHTVLRAMVEAAAKDVPY